MSITDVECSSCKQLLFRPVFLNCGHGNIFNLKYPTGILFIPSSNDLKILTMIYVWFVYRLHLVSGYCETCISILDVEVLKCQVCPSLHPNGVPKVCLELDHFLEKHFPTEYSLRKEAVQLKKVQSKTENNIGNSGSCMFSLLPELLYFLYDILAWVSIPCAIISRV